MKQNVHNIERIVRIIVGLAIISLVFIGPKSAWGWLGLSLVFIGPKSAWGWLGLIPLATGAIGWCPPYALFGFSTYKKPE
jgi:hypothetical protein